MNYIKLINNFWNVSEINSFGRTEIALYFYLLRVNNLCQWRVEFKHNNYRILASLGIKDLRTLSDARKKLKSAGLIDFTAQNGSAEVYYRLVSYANNAEVDLTQIQTDSITYANNAEVIAEVFPGKDKGKENKQNNDDKGVLAENRKISEFKNFLKKEKQIQMDRLKMSHKLSDEDLDLKNDEFVEKKVSWGDDDKWRNSNDMAKNFEFWLNKNPKVLISNFQSWDKKQFFDEISNVGSTLSRETKQEFFDHYIQPTSEGTMLFQSFKAWDTKTRIRKWLDNKKFHKQKS